LLWKSGLRATIGQLSPKRLEARPAGLNEVEL
jgi:hypothetical protein